MVVQLRANFGGITLLEDIVKKAMILLPAILCLSITGPAFAQNVEYVGSTLLSGVNDVKVRGDYAYCADIDGLIIIGISDPENPTFISQLYCQGQGEGIHISGNYAYLADGESGLQIIDVSDPSNPTFAASYDTPGNAYGVFVSGSYAYLADRGSGLQIIDISDPTSPLFAGSLDTPGDAYGVFVSDSYAYLADMGSGLQIIDVSDPSSPTIAAGYDTPGITCGVFISGSYAYLADRDPGLQIIDVSDPLIPMYAASYDPPGAACRVFISGGYAYLGAWGSGLQIINVSDPLNPMYAGGYDTPGSSYGVFVAGDYTYVADSYSLIILRFDPQTGIDDVESLPKQIALRQNYPNPFNAATMIKYNLPEQSDVTIEIYDILGRRVETLVQSEQQAGYHQVVWDAEDASSGIYFYRIQAGDFVETRRMLLLR